MKEEKIQYVAPEIKTVTVNYHGIVCMSPDQTLNLILIDELWDSEEEEDEW